MYCSIIGHPLKNPRSIPIWKSYFKKKKLKIKMKGIDVLLKKFDKLILSLKKDKNFFASAVTMPYKKSIFKHADILDDSAKLSKSINLIIKKKNKIKGFNTDVYGAYETVKKIKKDKIIIYGYGGAGSAICNYFSKKYKKSKIIVISSKKRKLKTKNVKLKKKIDSVDLCQTNLFINASPLGSNLKKNYISRTPIDQNELKKMKKNSTIFDIVYKPKKNRLSKLCKKNRIKYFNGLKMNTLQAQKALQILSDNIFNIKG